MTKQIVAQPTDITNLPLAERERILDELRALVAAERKRRVAVNLGIVVTFSNN